jgi:hypothetical protein
MGKQPRAERRTGTCCHRHLRAPRDRSARCAHVRLDNSTPITLSVEGAEIRSATPVSTRRGGGLAPALQVRDNELEIGPGLIGRNQVLIYTLVSVTKNQLIPSGQAPVTLTNALIDTKLRTDKRSTLIGIGVIVVVAAAFFGLWYGWLRHTSIAFHSSNLTKSIAVVASLYSLVRLLRRARADEQPEITVELKGNPPQPVVTVKSKGKNPPQAENPSRHVRPQP